jgi:hypothetical protein
MMVDDEQVMRCGLLAAGTNQLCYVRTYDGETDEQAEEENSSGVLSLESKLGWYTMSSKIRRRQDRQAVVTSKKSWRFWERVVEQENKMDE